MPAVPVLVALIELLGPWLLRFFMLKAAFMVAKVFAVIGVGLATNEFIIDPMLDHIETAWGAMPAELHQWFDALGFNNAVSIILSASAIAGLEKVILRKA